MFDEMYLQKSEDFVGGQLYGANTDGELYKGVMCYMIIIIIIIRIQGQPKDHKEEGPPRKGAL